MSATILTFVRRPDPEPAAECVTAVDSPHLPDGPAPSPPPSPRQIAHRWAMLAHLTRREGETPPGTVR